MGAYNPIGIRGISHYSLPVSDIDTSQTFYEEILGAEVFEDDNGPHRFGYSDEDKALGREKHVFLLVAGQHRIELLERDPERKTPLGTHHAYAIGPNDVRGVERHLREHGIPFNGPCTHRGTAAVSIYFSDPDGNALEFCCWDGYPNMDEIPLLQQIERKDTRFEWDAESRRAVGAS
jgi:catechol 2,3-dioxygenase-like lactoylglutathione lyase family enzyme